SSMIAILRVCMCTLGASLYSSTASQPRSRFIAHLSAPARPSPDDTAEEGSDDLFGGHEGTITANLIEEQADCRGDRAGARTVGHVETVSGAGQFDVADRRAGHSAQPLDEGLRLRDRDHTVAGTVHHQKGRGLRVHPGDRRSLAEQVGVAALLLVD